MKPAFVIHDEPAAPATGAELMARLQSLATGHVSRDRRGQPPIPEPAAPAILRFDLAAIVEAVGEAADEAPVPFTALEAQLLDAAHRCAAGDAAQPPRRELVAVALRQVRREEAVRDRQYARGAEQQRAIAQLRETQRGLLAINAELVAALAEQFGCTPSASDVLTHVRASRSTLAQAIAAVGDLRDAQPARVGGGEA